MWDKIDYFLFYYTKVVDYGKKNYCNNYFSLGKQLLFL